MNSFLEELRFLNPHAKRSGITYLFYPGRNGEEMKDLLAFEVLQCAWKVSAVRTFLDQLLHANLVIMGNHTAEMASCGAKGLLDYLILPLIARKIIADFLLQMMECSERKKTHIDLSLKILLLPAIAVEIARYVVGLALTLVSVLPILGVNFCMSVRNSMQGKKQLIVLNSDEQFIADNLHFYR